jgi:hypothetical protein
VKRNYIIFAFYALFFVTSCKENIPNPLVKDKPISSFDPDTSVASSGDIVVASTGSKAVVALDSEGNYKSTIFTAADQYVSANIGAIAYKSDTQEILVSVYDTTTADTIWAVNINTGEKRILIRNGATVVAAAGLYGLLQLSAGNILVSEATNTFDIYNTYGNLVTNGAANPALTGNINQANPTSDGGLVACTVTHMKVFNSAYVQVGVTKVTPYTGCIQSATNTYIVSDDATDTIRQFTNPALWTAGWTYTNTNFLISPRGLAMNDEGDVLVTDINFDYIVVINSSGGLKKIINPGILSDPTHILVIP